MLYILRICNIHFRSYKGKKALGGAPQGVKAKIASSRHNLILKKNKECNLGGEGENVRI